MQPQIVFIICRRLELYYISISFYSGTSHLDHPLKIQKECSCRCKRFTLNQHLTRCYTHFLLVLYVVIGVFLDILNALTSNYLTILSGIFQVLILVKLNLRSHFCEILTYYILVFVHFVLYFQLQGSMYLEIDRLIQKALKRFGKCT